jgi:multidrug resistance efflux pump
MPTTTSEDLFDLSCKIKDLASRNHKEVRRSARIAEEDERKYEQILEKAREAERLKDDIENLQRELQKRENLIEKAAENERLKLEIERLNRDIVILHGEYRRWRGIAVARKAEITHRDNKY